jgi:hypothetical protein
MDLFRHAGLEELAPYLIRGHPDVVPTKPAPDSDPGVGKHFIYWVPIFIGNPGSRFSPGTLDSGFRRNDDLSGNR